MRPRVDPDEHAIERLLNGSTPPEDAAPELAPVASLIASARSAGTEAELGRLGSHVPAMVAVLRGNGATETATETTGGAHRAPRIVGVVLASVLGLSMVGAAAAATIQQPWRPGPTESSSSPSAADPADLDAGGDDSDDPARRSSTTLASNDPASDDPAATDPGAASDTEASTPIGPVAEGPARAGLCIAFGARIEVPGSSVAAENLRRAAEASGQSIGEFCSGTGAEPTSPVGPPGADGPPGGSVGAGGDPGDRPATGTAAPPADSPAVTAPARAEPTVPSPPTSRRSDIGATESSPSDDDRTPSEGTQGR